MNTSFSAARSLQYFLDDLIFKGKMVTITYDNVGGGAFGFFLPNTRCILNFKSERVR